MLRYRHPGVMRVNQRRDCVSPVIYHVNLLLASFVCAPN